MRKEKMNATLIEGAVHHNSTEGGDGEDIKGQLLMRVIGNGSKPKLKGLVLPQIPDLPEVPDLVTLPSEEELNKDRQELKKREAELNEILSQFEETAVRIPGIVKEIWKMEAMVEGEKNPKIRASLEDRFADLLTQYRNVLNNLFSSEDHFWPSIIVNFVLGTLDQREKDDASVQTAQKVIRRLTERGFLVQLDKQGDRATFGEILFRGNFFRLSQCRDFGNKSDSARELYGQVRDYLAWVERKRIREMQRRETVAYRKFHSGTPGVIYLQVKFNRNSRYNSEKGGHLLVESDGRFGCVIDAFGLLEESFERMINIRLALRIFAFDPMNRQSNDFIPHNPPDEFLSMYQDRDMLRADMNLLRETVRRGFYARSYYERNKIERQEKEEAEERKVELSAEALAEREELKKTIEEGKEKLRSKMPKSGPSTAQWISGEDGDLLLINPRETFKLRNWEDGVEVEPQRIPALEMILRRHKTRVGKESGKKMIRVVKIISHAEELLEERLKEAGAFKFFDPGADEDGNLDYHFCIYPLNVLIGLASRAERDK